MAVADNVLAKIMMGIKIEGGVRFRTRPLILSTGGVFPQPLRSSLKTFNTKPITMQLPDPPDYDKMSPVISAIQRERLMRYMPAAGRNEQIAFRYYLWNCHLSQSFHHALHFAEIVSRNALARALEHRCGAKWYENPMFLSLLDNDCKQELYGCVMQEQKQHGPHVTVNHVISALSFGFWNHLATKRFERFLWAHGVKAVFQNAPNSATRQEVYDLIESVRRWRNRIAHHRAIFDKSPMRKHQDALVLIRWACDITGHWVSGVSRVPAALGLRPKS